MQSTRWKVRLACGLSLFFLAGCFQRYPYGPFGQGAYPGVYNTPPAGSAVPNGVIMQPPSTLIQPGGQTQQWRGSQDPVSPGLDAPAFDPNKGSTGNPSGTNAVPEYKDPGDLDSGRGDLDLNKSKDDAQAPFGYKQTLPQNTVQQASHEEMTASSAGDGADSFVAPLPAEPAQTTHALAKSDEAAGPRRPNPFDHDRENYRWLRGVVDYDEQDGTWNIIYDMNPDPTDRFGGSITLLDDERLSTLRDNDVVLVHGRVDSSARDRLGKPRYDIDDLARLVPKDKKQLVQSDR